VNAVVSLPAPPELASVETEAGLCASLLAFNDLVDPIADIVTPEDFTDEFYRYLFTVILREHSAGHVVSAISLKGFFQPDSYTHLANLGRQLQTVIGARDFARQIADLGKRRRLIEGLTEVISDARQTEIPVARLVDSADTAMTHALQKSTAVATVSLAQSFDTTLKAIDDEAAGLGPQGIHVDGLDDFNDLTGELRRGELMYLGGRTSMGKTALSLKIALGAAKAGNGVALISLEMRASELTTRAMTDLVFEYARSCPTIDQVRRGRLSPEHRALLAEARKQIDQWPLMITDPASLNIGRLAMEIRRQRRKLNALGQSLDLVIVDYLGLIKGDPKAKRYEEVGEVSRTLKQIAKECDVAMVVLAQLNRKCEERDDKRPMLSDLRDAGDIEQDADHVMFVYRDEYYLERSEPDVHDKKRADWEVAMGHARDRVELILAKARNGRVGKRNCYFFAKHQAVRASSYMRSDRQETSDGR
jgi:replicative DNA helicase